MTFYGGKELADSFRTVRKNTIQIAQDIPEDEYTFRPTPDARSVAEELAHVAATTDFYHRAHAVDKVNALGMADFGKYMGEMAATEKKLTTKSQIVEALQKNGEQFAGFLESLTADALGHRVTFEPPIQPSTRTRFEMLLAAKEHEMHHRAKLMVIERLIGIVPHLTREREQRMAAMANAPKA